MWSDSATCSDTDSDDTLLREVTTQPHSIVPARLKDEQKRAERLSEQHHVMRVRSYLMQRSPQLSPRARLAKQRTHPSISSPRIAGAGADRESSPLAVLIKTSPRRRRAEGDFGDSTRLSDPPSPPPSAAGPPSPAGLATTCRPSCLAQSPAVPLPSPPSRLHPFGRTPTQQRSAVGGALPPIPPSPPGPSAHGRNARHPSQSLGVPVPPSPAANNDVTTLKAKTADDAFSDEKVDPKELSLTFATPRELDRRLQERLKLRPNYVVPIDYLRSRQSRLLRRLTLSAARQRAIASGRVNTHETTPGGADNTAEEPYSPIWWRGTQRDVVVSKLDWSQTLAIVAERPIEQCPTGEIPVLDVLVRVLLYVPTDMQTLLAVSSVSAAWREASARLPQWAIVPQLLHPAPSVRIFALQPAASDIVDGERPYALLRGFGVEDRDGFMHSMHLRSRIRERAQQLFGWRKYLFLQYYHAAVPLMLVAALTLAAVLYVAYAFGHSRPLEIHLRGLAGVSRSWSADFGVGFEASLAALVVVVTAGLPAILSYITVRKLTLRRARNRRWRAKYLVPALVIGIATLFTIPIAHLAARVAESDWLRQRPPVVYGYGPGECTNTSASLAWEDVPTYVQIADPWDWHIEPWILPPQTAGGEDSMFDGDIDDDGGPRYRNLQVRVNNTDGNFTFYTLTTALCDVAEKRRARGSPWWWGDAYVRGEDWDPDMDPRQSQCSDWLVTPPPRGWQDYYRYWPDFFEYVVLYPPDRLKLACPSVRPIALAIDRSSDVLNETIARLWTTTSPERHRDAHRRPIRVFHDDDDADGNDDDVPQLISEGLLQKDQKSHGVLHTFRTTAPTTWFALPYAHAGLHWFNSTMFGRNRSKLETEAPWIDVGRAERGYLWERYRIPLIVGSLQDPLSALEHMPTAMSLFLSSPFSLFDWGLAPVTRSYDARLRALLFIPTSLALFCFCLVLLPRRFVHGRTLNRVALITCCFLVNPLTYFGGVAMCYVAAGRGHQDACVDMCTSPFAAALFGGTLLTAVWMARSTKVFSFM